MATDAVTEEIRRRADIVEIIGQTVQLKPAGGDNFKACCPFHDEKTRKRRCLPSRAFLWFGITNQLLGA